MGLIASLRVIALALALAGCASVPTLRGSPEDVANAISANAVAYNQAYGRAIADQVLLNVMRARDRMPLYHLSMSGIQDSSELAEQFGELTIGSVSLGDGEGGVGQWVGGRTLTTKPGYTLNPFSSHDGTRQARQFEPVANETFQHYWDNNWSVEILLMIMVERLERGGRRIENTSHGYRGDCEDRPSQTELRAARARVQNETPPGEREDALRLHDDVTADRQRRCDFVWTVGELSNGDRPTLEPIYTGCAQPRPSDDNPTPRRHICTLKIRADRAVYDVRLRSIDDMLYFVGSIIRDHQDGRDPMTARVHVAPTNVYPADGENWSSRGRTAPLFRVVEVDRPQRGAYAAEVIYRGVRYAAGQATSAVCIGIDRCAYREGPHNDGSSRVLSLLTQLVILTQSEEAQLAPRDLGRR